MATLVALGAATAARAQETKTERPTTTTQQRQANRGQGAGVMNDRVFAAAAAVAGLAEVGTGRLALERATNQDIRKFAQRMIDDHSKANQELTSLATSKGITLPRGLDVKDQAASEALACEQGEKFDRCYAKMQLTAHMDAVALFKAEAEHGQDPEIKAWASRTLPTLREHLKMIRQHARMDEDEEGSSDAPRKSEK